MKNTNWDDNNKKQIDNKKSKKPYQKPLLQKYGSVVSLTAGLGGSVIDSSGPGTMPR